MTRPRTALVLGFAALFASDREPPPEPVGPVLFEWETGDGVYSLHHDGFDTVQILGSDGELEILAALEDETASFLAREFESLRSGETEIGHFDPACLGWRDRYPVTLSIPSPAGTLRFSHPWQCGPSGLANIDAVMVDLVLAMLVCSPSEHLASCEISRRPSPP